MPSSHSSLAVYQRFSFKQRGRILLLGLLATTCLGVQAFAVEGYNINEGQEPSNTSKLPYTDLSRPNRLNAPYRPLLAAPVKPANESAGALSITPPPHNNLKASSLDDGGKQSLAQVATPASQVGFIQPISSVALPNKPLYPSRSEQPSMPTVNALNTAVQSSRFDPESAPTPVASATTQTNATPVSSSESLAPTASQPIKSPPPAPLNLPPVSDAVKAQAEKELAASASSLNKEQQANLTTNPIPLVSNNLKSSPDNNVVSNTGSTHIALPPPPAPLLARSEGSSSSLVAHATPDVSSTAQSPKNSPQPLTVENPPEVLGSIESGLTTSSPTSIRTPLTQDSRKILGSLQPIHKVAATSKSGRVDVKRISPDVADIVKKATQVYESAGVSLKVSPVRSDPTIELSKAYDALMAGDNGAAIQIYQDILRNNPTNEEALFGLAATYHRTGQLENARSLYGRLLAQNPSHREGLNNFLVLAANEAPEETLEELAKLELRNPDFSPIPAQMGIILDRLGKPELARNKMIRAIQLAPENWAYKYNLAVMLDRQGYYADASQLYKDLITASLRGEKIPGNQAALQERLNYISARVDGKNAG